MGSLMKPCVDLSNKKFRDGVGARSIEEGFVMLRMVLSY